MNLIPANGEREFFANFLNQEFIPVYSSWRSEDSNGAIYLILGPVSERVTLVQNPSWPLHIGDSIPSFSGSSDGNSANYHTGDDDGFIPLAYVRSGEGIVESYPEPLQEFILLFNLHAAEGSRIYFEIDGAGNKSKAVEIISENEILFRTDLVKKFQAAKQMDLILQIDSVQFTQISGSNKKEIIYKSEFEYIGNYPFGDYSPEGYRYFGKIIVPPGPMSTCGIWPFEELTEIQQEFTLAGDGGEVRIVKLSSNAKYDPNSFLRAQNVDYLEPVQFNKELLRRYLGNPDIYLVTDTALKCGSLWSINIDIESEDKILVYAGDLLRDLPPQEWNYWKAFNETRNLTISESTFRRDFLGQFSESTKIDHRFRSNFVTFQDDWYQSFGWRIFKPLLKEDDYVLKTLHLPLSDNFKDFDDFVLKLTKLTTDAFDIDYLIEFENVSARHRIHPVDGFADWLESKHFPNVDSLKETIMNIQWLRSKGAAHAKKPTYIEECRRLHGLSPSIQLSEKICSEMNMILEKLSEHFFNQ